MITRRPTLPGASSLLPAWLLTALIILILSGCHSSRHATPVKPSSPSAPPSASMSPSAIANSAVNTIAEATAALMKEADAWLGTPYRYGASERGKGADCSGLVTGVFQAALNLKLPRSSREQAGWCSPLKEVKEAIPGDLVFFAPGGKGAVNHVGIYLGQGRFVHASSSRGVMVSSLDEPYFTRNYQSVGRVEPYYKLVVGSSPNVGASRGMSAPAPAAKPTAKPAEKAAKPAAAPAILPRPAVSSDTRPDTILDASEARRRLLMRLSENTDSAQCH